MLATDFVFVYFKYIDKSMHCMIIKMDTIFIRNLLHSVPHSAILDKVTTEVVCDCRPCEIDRAISDLPIVSTFYIC